MYQPQLKYKPESLYKSDINDLVADDMAKGGVGSGVRGHQSVHPMVERENMIREILQAKGPSTSGGNQRKYLQSLSPERLRSEHEATKKKTEAKVA